MQEYSTKTCPVCENDFECATSYPERNRVYCSKLCQGRAQGKRLKESGPASHVEPRAKRCPKCGETREPHEFYKDAKRPDGLTPWCKACCSSEHKKHYDPQYEVDRRARLKQDPEWVAKEHERDVSRYQKRSVQNAEEAVLPKVCSECGQTKTRADFSLNHRFKDGRLNRCKECHAAIRRAQYEEDAEERRKKANARYASDVNARQRALNQQRRWRMANREKMTATHKAYYEANRETIAEQKRRKYETRQDWLMRQKEGHVCRRCGMDDIRCLDWHHIDPETKIFNVGEAAANTTLTQEEVLFEISKCTTICSNCHRIEHWEEREARKVRK